MDLTKFTSSKNKNEKKELIINNNEIKIVRIGDQLEFEFKKESALEKYQNFLFFSPTEYIITKSNIKASSFFKKSLNDGVEGLMFKNLNAEYVPGLRVGTMAKLKETKEDIDVVILGAEHGKGKRAGFFSSFLIGVIDDSSLNNELNFVQIGKVSSGIQEKENSGGISILKINNLLKPLKLYEKNSITYFEPKIIIQVRYQEIQKSNTYDSGYALRFPRMIFLREDKSLEEINTLSDIKKFSNY